jgi:hypothetical protein
METAPHSTAGIQTPATECRDRSVQVVASAADCSIQVEVFAVDNGVQTIVSVERVDGSTQDDRTATTEMASQSELSTTMLDCGVQAEEAVTPSVEESAQTEHHDRCDCTVQTEVELATTSVQTNGLVRADHETQATCIMADHETSTQDEIRTVESAVQANEADWREADAPISITPRVLLPLDVYFQVHRSIIRLQCIIRGHTVSGPSHNHSESGEVERTHPLVDMMNADPTAILPHAERSREREMRHISRNFETMVHIKKTSASNEEEEESTLRYEQNCKRVRRIMDGSPRESLTAKALAEIYPAPYQGALRWRGRSSPSR